MKDTLIELTKRWIDAKGVPAFDFTSRSITQYESGNIVLLGMRRLGKTEYLKFRLQKFLEEPESYSGEIVSDGIDSGVSLPAVNDKTERVLFIDFDSPQFVNISFDKKESKGFLELSNTLIEIIKENEIKLVLIDEIQHRIDWSRWLKGLSDQFGDVTFVATGSDAVKLKKSGEHGGTRFKTVYIGPLTYKEYKESHRSEEYGYDVVDYFDNVVYPTKKLDGDIKDLYANVVEKQIAQTNILNSNIRSVFRAIALNPGQDLNPNAISKTARDGSDSKVDHKQVEHILEFLVNSQLIYRIENKYTGERSSRKKEYKYYPSSWNAYKFFTSKETIRDLDETTIPKSGFVFENVIMSNVLSSQHEQMDIDKVGYFDDKKGKECDLVFGDVHIEIKSMDLKRSDNKAKLDGIVKKMKKLDNPIIIHTGKTFEVDSIMVYSYEDFLGGELWIQKK